MLIQVDSKGLGRLERNLYPSEFKNWEFGEVGAWIFQQAARPALKQTLLTNRVARVWTNREGEPGSPTNPCL